MHQKVMKKLCNFDAL